MEKQGWRCPKCKAVMEPGDKVTTDKDGTWKRITNFDCAECGGKWAKIESRVFLCRKQDCNA